MQTTPPKFKKRVEVNIVDGYKLIESNHYMKHIEQQAYDEFFDFYNAQVKQDPYSEVRDRAMIKLIYQCDQGEFRVDPNQYYFQTYEANDTDGGKVRIFPQIAPSALRNQVFCTILGLDKTYLNEFAKHAALKQLNISVHFIRYKTKKGDASYSSPVWLHTDNEPLVFIHLVRLTKNAIGADSVISEMDNYPTHVYRLQNPLDTLIVDRTKKHAVTPLGSTDGMAYRDVMLVNLEADVQQQ